MDQAGIVNHRVMTAQAALIFLFGGKATFTFVSLKSGDRFTYMVQEGKKKKETDASIYFVKLMNGPDNDNDFAYFGYIKNNTFTHGARKACASLDSPSVKAFMWAFAQFQLGIMPLDKLEMLTASKCARCGHKLTVDDSIHNGFGPECIGKVGGVIAMFSTPSMSAPVQATAGKVTVPAAPTPKLTPVFVAGRPVQAQPYKPTTRQINEMIEWKRVNDPEGYWMDGEMPSEEEARKFWTRRFRTVPLEKKVVGGGL